MILRKKRTIDNPLKHLVILNCDKLYTEEYIRNMFVPRNSIVCWNEIS